MIIYKCMGRRRPNEDGRPVCDFESRYRWPSSHHPTRRCPKCHMPYECRAYGQTESKVKRSTAADAIGAKVKYLATGLEHVDFVLGGHDGGGLVRGSTILFGGPQGSGKTGLAVMIADAYQQKTKQPVLYASGEQDDRAVGQVCNRVGVFNPAVEIMGSTRNVHAILARCKELQPALLILDSIQEMSEHGGFVTTASDNVVAAKIVHDYCEKKKSTAIVINHVNSSLEYKGGSAIPHLVETEMFIYRFSEQDDGDPQALFGERDEDGEDDVSAMRRRRRRRRLHGLELGFDIEKVRTLLTRKNRNGIEHRKVYYLMTEAGQLQPLKHNEKRF